MKKSINQRKRFINLNMGFFGDENFGVNYDKLFETFQISDFFKYAEKGEVKVEEYWMKSNLICSCEKLDWDTDFDVWVNVRFLPFQNLMVVTFRIVENLEF